MRFEDFPFKFMMHETLFKVHVMLEFSKIQE